MKSLILFSLSRIIPGIIAFISIGIYIKMIGVTNFGIYSIYLSTAGIIYNFLFNWSKNVYSKMVLSSDNVRNEVISVMLILQMILVLILIPVGIVVAKILELSYFYLIFYVMSLAILNLTLEQLKNNMNSKKYMFVNVSRSVLFFFCSLALLYFFSKDYKSILISYIFVVNFLAIISLDIKRLFSYMKFFKKSVFKKTMKLGLPLILVYGSSYILANSDRILISKFLNYEEAGKYSAFYDLISFPILTIVMISYLFYSPRLLKSSDLGGKIEMQYSNFLILSISPVLIVFLFLGQEIIFLITGIKISSDESYIVPMITVSIFALTVKSYFIDIIYLKNDLTHIQIIPVLISVVLNVILNIYFIPKHGISGAAYTTLISYLAMLIISFLLIPKGSRPKVLGEDPKKIFIPVLSLFVINFLFVFDSFFLEIIKVLLSFLVYAFLFVLLNNYNVKNMKEYLGLNENEKA